MKATVCVGDYSCRLKVRFYAEPNNNGTFVVELQRRSGDERVFQEVYGLAVRHFLDSKDFTAFPRTQVADLPMQRHELVASVSHVGEVLAILDTAGFGEVHDLQVQAALALARAATDAQQAVQLCTSRVLEGVRVMLRSTCIDVQWPLSQFLIKLLCIQDSDSFLAGLREELQEAVVADTTHPLARGLLQEVLLLQ